jgi:prevent-host-death family protein
MTVNVVDSNRARLHWRDVLDAARAGSDTVIEHYNKPTAAVIPYADFVALQEALEDLRAARRAQAAYDAWQKDPSTGTALDQVEAELRAEGLLDA